TTAATPRIADPIPHTHRESPGDINAPVRTIATPIPAHVALMTNVSARPRTSSRVRCTRSALQTTATPFPTPATTQHAAVIQMSTPAAPTANPNAISTSDEPYVRAMPNRSAITLLVALPMTSPTPIAP